MIGKIFSVWMEMLPFSAVCAMTFRVFDKKLELTAYSKVVPLIVCDRMAVECFTFSVMLIH